MPFRDRDWEDFQRDCDFFPAYTDYIFGMDARSEVADEPGLHPQIFEPPSLPPQRIYGLLPPVQYPVAYDPVRDETQPRPYTMPAPLPSLLRHESPVESLLPTPCPAPRSLPPAGPSMALLRPGELTADLSYSFIPQQERMIANKNITQAWSTINSDAVPAQKAKAVGYLKNMSRMAAIKKQEHQDRMYQDHAFAGLKAQETQAEEDAERQADMRHSGREGSAYSDRYPYNETRQAEAETECTAERVLADHEYAVRVISQLPAYVQSHLPQLWTCTEIIALQAPPADPVQLDVHRKTQQYLRSFKQSLPPKGRQWLDLVIDGMLKIRKQGGDPLTVLETMPSVQDMYGMGG
ncbi:hypothetical protein BU25DRAFT_461607 [Macroventuria anomochaeta]|uniref:Uncharacterized protein n=1 Tax=Macroventuria anomochaeta TaxID=301207 RepID=A0ACB6RPV9_9PLEO|nr:uncharacterized protein BU25DRAFT_461607 [Macroventuria anomochaeta]KAF2623809.1 hypothetical protein BU25DRAFT_461607 [Macroventuria anomochaeta]